MERKPKLGLFRESMRGFALIACLMCASVAMAQLDTGTISGTVRDQSGGAIPGVAITMRNTETGIARNTQTNAAGRYEAVALPVGSYEVSAALSGFQTLVRSGINLTVGRNAVVNLTLQVGEVTQSVTVTGEASFVETTTATVSNLVDERKVTEIPLNNRDLNGLAFLQPGVLHAPLNQDSADVSVVGAGEKMTVAGMRATYNTYLLDGVSNSDVSGNAASVAGAYEGAETIQEFQVITNNYSAEYSNRPGAIISAVTKSGTNTFHGSAYEFLRNDNLDAAKWEDNAFGGSKGEFKRNNFGGSLGGPIIQDKTFFFASYEGVRERRGRTETAFIPSAGAHNGDLGRDGVVPVNPVMKPYIDLYPLPGQGNTIVDDVGDGRVLVSGTSQRPVNDDFGNVKLDHQFANPRTGFLAVTYSTSSADRSNVHFIPDSEPSLGFESRKHVISARHTSVISPTALNEFSFGYTYAKTTADIPITSRDWSKFLWLDDSLTMGNLNPADDNVINIGFGADPSFFQHKTFSFKDNLTLTLPSHTLKFGAEIMHSRLPVHKEPDGANGRFDFDNLTKFWAGVPAAFDASLPAGATVLGLTNLADPEWHLRQSQFGFFVQDNWKVLPSLTLNLGLRYEFQTTLSDRDDHLSSFRDFFGDQVTVGGPFFKNPTLKNFSPRIGFAWSPDGATSIRGGLGMFYVPTGIVEYQYVLGQLAPFLGEGGLTDNISIDFPNAFRTQAEEMGGSPNYRQLEYDQSPTRIYRWSLTVEREMGNWFVSAGYSGSRGLHLPVTGEANLNKWAGWPNNVPTAEKQFIDGELINPLMNRLTVTWMQGNSYYHGASFNVMRRLSNGLQFQAAYTVSKATDQSVTTGNRTEGFGQAQRTNLLWDMDHWKGRSSFDMRNNLVMNLTYDVPRISAGGVGAAVLNGWQVNSIITLSDGPPFTLFDQNNTPQRRAFERRDQIRPNLIPGGNNDPVNPGNPNYYYDVTQFVPSVCRGIGTICQKGDPGYAVGYFGNLGFNTLTGPGIATMDFSINKSFEFGEDNRLQFRAEFFNLLNRPNFGTPNDAPFLQSGSGNNLRVNPTVLDTQIDDTRTSARQIQFGLRYTF